MAEKQGEDRYSYAGHHFRWTSDHISKEDTRRLQFECDDLGSQVVEELQAIMQKQKKEASAETPVTTDMYTLLCNHHGESKVLSEFWNQVHTVPEWVDWEQIERGQKFFYRYALANMVGFALQSFLGESTTSSSVVEILVRTGGFSVRTLRRRLLSTFQFILQVSESVDAVRAGGDGHTTAIRVRLLHASVRNRVRALVASNPEYFDTELHGIPVNALDSVHSISTFSCNHMWLQLPQMGVYPREEEIADYIALYRYMAYLLGTRHEYFETTAKAKAVMESMLVNERRLTPNADTVSHNMIQFLTNLQPLEISAGFIEAGSRKLNGNELCDALHMERPGWYPYACYRGLCWFVRALAFAQQHCSPLDTWMIKSFRNLLHQTIIHGQRGLSGGSRMRFKYIPRLGKLTGKETAPWSDRQLYFFQRPFELFFFGVFVFGCVSMPVMAWVVCWIGGYLHKGFTHSAGSR